MNTTDHLIARLRRRIVSAVITILTILVLFTALSATYNAVTGASAPGPSTIHVLLATLGAWIIVVLLPEELPF